MEKRFKSIIYILVLFLLITKKTTASTIISFKDVNWQYVLHGMSLVNMVLCFLIVVFIVLSGFKLSMRRFKKRKDYDQD